VLEVIEQKNLKGSEKNINLCYSGVFCGSAKSIYELLNKVKKNKTQKEFLLTDIFKIANEENVSLSLTLANENEVMGINNMYQLSLAEERYQKKLREKFMMKGIILQRPETIYFSFDTRIESNVKIGPNNTFGKHVVIKKNAYIAASNNIEQTVINDSASVGPFCRLRGGVKIGKFVRIGNFVEIKNSNIGNFSKINHLSYVGDASIGANSNIGAGTITCNYDGKAKHKTMIGNNVFIGSNCALIAPIKISNKAFIAAGSTISNDVGVNDFSIARAKQKLVKKGRKKFLK
jgi:bifunctional UDP-N-acetylglucosamine pyrophosphorylase/glucosamine-1-phosphate N-acetyltransferase